MDPHILTIFRFKCNPKMVQNWIQTLYEDILSSWNALPDSRKTWNQLTAVKRHIKVNNGSTWVVENNNTDNLVADIGHAFEDDGKVSIRLNHIGNDDTDCHHDQTIQDKIMLKICGDQRLKECRRNDAGVRGCQHRQGKKTPVKIVAASDEVLSFFCDKLTCCINENTFPKHSSVNGEKIHHSSERKPYNDS